MYMYILSKTRTVYLLDQFLSDTYCQNDSPPMEEHPETRCSVSWKRSKQAYSNSTPKPKVNNVKVV